MTVSQLLALWVGMSAIVVGALARIFRLLVKLVTAVEGYPALREAVDDHEGRLLAVERGESPPRLVLPPSARPSTTGD